MFPILKNAVQNLARTALILPKPSNLFHTLTKPPQISQTTAPSLLKPLDVNVTPVCGFKVMGKVRRRCKDCYFVWRDNRLYNLCKTHPRHKQMSMVRKEKYTWILSHATQGKVRPW